MSFSIYNFNIVLCTGNQILIYNLEKETENIINLPKLENKKDFCVHNNEEIESFHVLTSVAFSEDGQYFLVCVNRKQLCLFRTESSELMSHRVLPRAASKVRFLPNNDIVVADKCGDAYVFSTTKSCENGQLLLGHLSMLLDIMVTNDQKYVITADRDEKIRVSMFPNSYNILSYCLGHKNFVTNVGILPHDKSILVSSGGDGTLRFWDFQKGIELLTVYYHEQLSQSDLLQLNKILRENDLVEDVIVSPVKHLIMSPVNKYESIVLISFFCSNVILYYRVLNEQNVLTAEYMDSIILEMEPLECQFNKDQLWILTNSKIQAYKLDGTCFVTDKAINSAIEKLNQSWKNLHSVTNLTLLPVLYKRKFDNVQEYQERKKSRLIK